MKSPLRKARALISDPKKWTRLAYWRKGPKRCPVLTEVGEINAPAGARFCAMGACYQAKVDENVLRRAAYTLSDGGTNGDVITFNDAPGRTHDEVMWMFDLAIAFDEVGAP